MNAFELVYPAGCRLAEAPLWQAERAELVFVDVTGRRIHRWAPEGGSHVSLEVDEDIGFVALARRGGYVAGLRSGIWLLDEHACKVKCLAGNPADTHTQRFNDGGIDPCGRLIIGTIDQTRREGRAGLYRLEAGGLRKIAANLMTSNGVAFAPDGRTLYHSDTPRFVIFRRDYCPQTGAIGAAGEFARLDPQASDRARPDGAAVDAQGCYWSALYEGSRVHQYDSSGRLIAAFPVPARSPTMPAFGGDDLRTLYLTTARADDGSGGGIYAMRVTTPGLPQRMFDEEPFLS